MYINELSQLLGMREGMVGRSLVLRDLQTAFLSKSDPSVVCVLGEASSMRQNGHRRGTGHPDLLLTMLTMYVPLGKLPNFLKPLFFPLYNI